MAGSSGTEDGRAGRVYASGVVDVEAMTVNGETAKLVNRWAVCGLPEAALMRDHGRHASKFNVDRFAKRLWHAMTPKERAKARRTMRRDVRVMSDAAASAASSTPISTPRG